MLRHLKNTIMTYSYICRPPEWAIDTILYQFSKNLPMKLADVLYLKEVIEDTDPKYISSQIRERLQEQEDKALRLQQWIQKATDVV